MQLVRAMGHNGIADILSETPEVEKQTDQPLTELALSSIDLVAENESEE